MVVVSLTLSVDHHQEDPRPAFNHHPRTTVTPSDHFLPAWSHPVTLHRRPALAELKRTAAHPHPQFLLVTIYSIWRILAVLLQLLQPQVIEFRNILRLFNAACVPNALRGRIIYGPIYERIPTNVLLSALSVGKRLLVNTIASDTKDFIAVRKSSFVGATWALDYNGVAADDLHAPMHWADISGPRRAEYVSNLC